MTAATPRLATSDDAEVITRLLKAFFSHEGREVRHLQQNVEAILCDPGRGFFTLDNRFGSFGNLRLKLGFLHDNYRCYDCFRRFVQFNAGADLQVGNVDRVCGRQIRNIDFDRFRSIRGLAKDLDLAKCL